MFCQYHDYGTLTRFQLVNVEWIFGLYGHLGSLLPISVHEKYRDMFTRRSQNMFGERKEILKLRTQPKDGFNLFNSRDLTALLRWGSKTDLLSGTS